MLAITKNTLSVNQILLQIFQHKDQIKRHLSRFIQDQDDVEDLFQELFTKTHQAITNGKYQNEEKLLPWVLRMASNMAIDFIRKNKKFVDGVCIENCSLRSECGIEDLITNKQHRSILCACIHLLPPDQKEIIVLYYFENRSFKEIALLKGISINTALGRMRYALQKLRKLVVPSQLAA